MSPVKWFSLLLEAAEHPQAPTKHIQLEQSVCAGARRDMAFEVCQPQSKSKLRVINGLVCTFCLEKLFQFLFGEAFSVSSSVLTQ